MNTTEQTESEPEQTEPTVTRTLVTYWRTEHRVTMPASQAPWGTPATWDEVMALVEADPDLGDVDTAGAEVTDWDMSS